MLPIEPTQPDRPRLVERHCTYEQDADSEGGDGFGQWIEVFTQDAGVGAFVVIKTERWAIDPDQIDDFADMLRDVLRGVAGLALLASHWSRP